jgi:aerobic-type carbon monoxide dehydrogenase small subunit (CoxS/CutS family)
MAAPEAHRAAVGAVDRRMVLETTVNGRPLTLQIRPEELLLDVIRDHLGLTGSKRSCDVQVCGACTVLLDGQPVSACSVLAYEARGRAVVTIEGLADGERLDAVQEAFLEERAFQCGYCTAGMIMAVKALLTDHPGATSAEAAEYLRGNICRCTGYVSILQAVARAQRITGARTAKGSLSGERAADSVDRS